MLGKWRSMDIPWKHSVFHTLRRATGNFWGNKVHQGHKTVMVAMERMLITEENFWARSIEQGMPGTESSPHPSEALKGGGTDFPDGTVGKESVCRCRRHKKYGFDPWGWDDPLEDGMATHSSIHAWKIPRDREAWWATVHGVAESRTWLKD